MAALVCASAPALQACDNTDCAASACSDYAYVTIESPDGTWPDGSYELGFEADGTPHTCVLDVPDDVPDPNTPGSSLHCEPSRNFFVSPAVAECEPPRTGSCHHPDRFSLAGYLPGFVERVRLRVTRDDVEIFDQSRKVGYPANTAWTDLECESCRQGSVAFSIP